MDEEQLFEEAVKVAEATVAACAPGAVTYVRGVCAGKRRWVRMYNGDGSRTLVIEYTVNWDWEPDKGPSIWGCMAWTVDELKYRLGQTENPPEPQRWR